MEEAAAPYAAPKQITYENTFITEPEGYGEVSCSGLDLLSRESSLLGFATDSYVAYVLQQYVFKRHKVQAVLKQALRERMEGQQYDPVKAAQVPDRAGLAHTLILLCQNLVLLLQWQ
jgi:hypothetical protein